MNSMINKNQVREHIDHIEINREQINDPRIIVNKFNNFFANIGSESKKNIPSFLGNGVVNSMFIAPTTDKEIIDTIANLENISSLGCDGIQLHIIKFCKLELATILSHLINTSMSE